MIVSISASIFCASRVTTATLLETPCNSVKPFVTKMIVHTIIMMADPEGTHRPEIDFHDSFLYGKPAKTPTCFGPNHFK